MKTRNIMRKVLKITAGIVAGFLCLILAGAAWYVWEFYPRKIDSFSVNSPDLEHHVLIVSQGSDFKTALVSELCAQQRSRPSFIKVIDVGELDDIDPSGWDNIVILNTAMANRLSRPVRNFLNTSPAPGKVLLLVTSGGADYPLTGLAVDAVSGASRRRDVDLLAEMITNWLYQTDRTTTGPVGWDIAIQNRS